MKICLIEPPRYVSLTNPVSTVAMPPLGLAYIAGALRRAGHMPLVIDAHGTALDRYYTHGRMRVRGLRPDDIVARIPDDTDVVGVGCMFSALWPLVRELVSAIHARFPRTPIILGGEHGTGAPELSLGQAPLTAVVMGEGEVTVVEVLRALAANAPLSGVAGVACRERGAILMAPRRARIADIDTIPWPAWDLFDLGPYLAVNQPHGSSQGRFIPMLASRGCPFRCTFCTAPQMWQGRWIPRDVRALADEMEHYHRAYGITDFQFEDLTAFVRRDWILAFCAELARRGLAGITFQMPSGTRSEAIDGETAGALKRAGCHEIAFAPESGDERVLAAIGKQVSLPRMYEAARAALRTGINVGCFFVVGFPEDDLRSILRTFRAIVTCARIGFTNINVNAFSPQPNTESFRRLVAAGVIGSQDDAYLSGLFSFQDIGAAKISYNRRFSGFQVRCLVPFGVVLFYSCSFLFRPWRLLGVAAGVAGPASPNKTAKMARSLLGEARRIVRQRLTPARAGTARR